MRIRPWIMTASVTAVAAVALGVVVMANDPVTAPVGVKILFWGAAALLGWGIVATILLLAGSGLPQAAWSGIFLSAGLIGCLVMWQNGARDRRLLGTVVFATLSLAFAAWYRLRGRT